MTDTSGLTRRAMLAAPLMLAPAVAQAQSLPVVTMLGDSITSGYGLPASQALPAQLQRELANLGVRALVRGAAVVGSTTAGGLKRVDSIGSDTKVCVVALGGNDLLNFIAPAQVRANLDAIVRKLKARRIDVVLAGLQAPAELGAYARAFNGVFPTVAQAHRVTLHNSFLQGVLLDSRYNQPDLVHPNALGVQIIARRLAPVVAKALRSGAAARVSGSR
ncbi:MAG: GDSL-type esterase/lipase family protein [Pseudomonadota bacterium]|nr:GDSL-type esterase/lipase family protein [Pseudomonadota bacterium]